jgi:hypothetical protein
MSKHTAKISDETFARLTHFAFRKYGKVINTGGRPTNFDLTVNEIVGELLRKEGF